MSCSFSVIVANWHCISVSPNWSNICNAAANDIWGSSSSIALIWSLSSKSLSSLLISISSGSALTFSKNYLRRISSQPFFCTLIRSLNFSSGSSASKDTSENPHFSEQCFIISLAICWNAWFTHLIHCRRSTPRIISDAFFPLLIFEITCFKYCLRYLILKFRMTPASQGCNWEVVFFGKDTSLMFWKFPWGVSRCDGALSRNSRPFRFSTSSLWSKVVRTWVMISVVIHAFLLGKYCVQHGLEELDNFRKHRGTLLFPIITGLHTLNPLEDTKNAAISRSFDFLPTF